MRTGRDGVRQGKQTAAYWLEVAKENLADEIRDRMQQQGLTLTELARRLGKNQNYVSRLIKGDAALSLKTLVEIAFALGYRLRGYRIDQDSLLVPLEHEKIKYLNFARSNGNVLSSEEMT